MKSLALAVPEIAIAVLGWDCEPQSREGEAVGGRGWYRSNERCSPGNRWMAFGLRRAKVLG